MKFIHLADAHLDSPFRGLSFLPSAEFKQIYQAANQSLSRIVDLALQEKVDLVLIAGDTFDSSQPSPRAQLFFARQIKRLTAAKIQVVMIFGNHDHMKQADLLVSPSPYFKLLGDGEEVEKATFTTKSGFTYDVVGFSYLNNHIRTDLLPKFPQKTDNFTFGLMHAQVQENDPSHDVYAPFTLAEMQALGYDYFALGHIHARRTLSQAPWIVYPGNIQGRHINELGEKGCLLGQVDETSQKINLEFKATSPIIWQEKILNLPHALSQTALQKQIVTTLSATKQTSFFSLKIVEAQNLSQAERELVQDPDYWQTISSQLPLASQLVDVRFSTKSQLALNDNDRQAFTQAKAELFAPAEFSRLVNDWQKKDAVAAKLAHDPEFIMTVKQLTEVKLMSQLKGIDNETETD